MAKRYNNSYCFGLKSDVCGYPFRVSKQFHLEMIDDDGMLWIASGSARDMAKVVRDLEWAGYCNTVCYGRPVFCSKRKYAVSFNKNTEEFSVYRVRE